MSTKQKIIIFAMCTLKLLHKNKLILVVLYRAVVPRNYFSWYENRSLDSVRLLAKVKG